MSEEPTITPISEPNTVETIIPEKSETPVTVEQSLSPSPVALEGVVEAETVVSPSSSSDTSLPTVVEAEMVEDAKKEEQPVDDKGKTFRTVETGDKVYLVKNGTRRWIKNAETLKRLGFFLGQEKTVAFAELLKWPEEDAIDLTYPEDTEVSPAPSDSIASEGQSVPLVETKPYKVWS